MLKWLKSSNINMFLKVLGLKVQYNVLKEHNDVIDIIKYKRLKNRNNCYGSDLSKK